MTLQIINIDFQISSSSNLIRVADMSLWALLIDKESIIEITTPGSSKPIKKYFDKNKTNVYSLSSLNPKCGDDRADLEDGIYKFKVIGSPSKYYSEKYYLKTDLIQMDIDKIYISSLEKSIAFSIEIQNKLTDIEFLIKGAESFLRKGIVSKAGQLFHTAISEVERLSKKCR